MKIYVNAAEGLSSKDRIKIAKNSTDSKELARLAYDNSAKVRVEVARNPNTSAKALEILANDKDLRVLWGVAANLNTPAKSLEILSNDENADVRCGVAANPKTPVKILEMLAGDEDDLVRGNVAKNPNTPPKVLEMLANDEDEYVRRCVARNANTPTKVLELLANDRDIAVRAIARSNKNAPELQSETQPTPKTRNKKSPQTDWSIPLYSISNYSEIEEEIDLVIHDAANQYAKEIGGTADVNIPQGAYDQDAEITITFHTPEGDQVVTVSSEDILNPATSKNKKADCVKTVVEWMRRNLNL